MPPVFEFKYERLPGRKGSRIFKLKYVHIRCTVTWACRSFIPFVFSISPRPFPDGVTFGGLVYAMHVYAWVCVGRHKWVGACTNERFV